MEKALRIINEARRKRLIGKCAIGGGVAAIRYMESVLTYDVDIFFLPIVPDAPLMDMTPLISFLRSKGGRADGAHVIFEGTPVQLIPAYNDLVVEAVNKAVTVSYGKVKAKILGKEYVAAIMLQTGRPKDKIRLGQMFQQSPPKKTEWMRLVRKYDLIGKWKRYTEQFGEPFEKRG